MAQWIFTDLIKKERLEEEFCIDSAATSREEIGNPIYPPARRKLEEKGIPVGEHYATQITKADYDRYDLIIIMDGRNKRLLSTIIPEDPDGKIHTLMSYTGQDAEIADPWYTGDFERAYQDILKGCSALLESLIL